MNTASPTITRTGSLRTSPPDSSFSGLHRYAVVVACITFLLVIAGGLVTSTGSSLAVPDWPLSNGQLFPRMEGGVLYEHGHRLIAGTVMILTLVLTIWVYRKDERFKVRALGAAAFGIILLQAIMGGVTVLSGISIPVSVAHACLGQIFFTLIVSIAVLTGSAAVPAWPAGKLSKFQRLSLMTVGFVLLQLIAGATLRHTGNRIALHVHLLVAFLVVVHIQLLTRRVFQLYFHRTGTARLAMGLSFLVIAQLFLGYVSWKTGPVITTTAHVAIGALLLAGTTVLMLKAFSESGASA
jgi:cytochrome c oxidase assembly protein subunit 15